MFKSLTLIGTTIASVASTNLFLQKDDELKLETDSYDPKYDINESPVVGILTQTLEDYMKKDSRFENYTSYIMSSYVKYMEAQGARVVPIVWGEDKELTLTKVKHLDGVLFPGGDGDNVDIGRLVF